MIVKRSDGYYVKSEKGKNLGGPYKSRKKAEERLAQVEKFKHMNKSMYVIVEKSDKVKPSKELDKDSKGFHEELFTVEDDLIDFIRENK